MAGDEYPAGTVDVGGVTVNAYVTDAGEWFAVTGETGRRVTADSKQELETQLRKIGKAATSKLSIPFILATGGAVRTYKAGTVVGRHGGNGNLIVKLDGKTGTEQISRHDVGRTVLGGEATIEEWSRLKEAADAAGRDLYAYEVRHRIDLMGMVREAIAAQIGEEPASED